jgi:LuxR family maltose regulon positive regulatory protein
MLQTKLYAPTIRPHLVQRPVLLGRIREQGRRPLTLTSAPAGFGKTTLISAWLAQNSDLVAWLSLDEDDNEPTRF